MTEEKKSMVPKLRFPEFTATWEQRELNTAATFLNGRAFSQSELLSKGKYPVLRVGNFYTNDKWYFSDLVLPEKFYANKGDLLYTWSATFGPHIWEGWDKVIYHYHIWKLLLGKDTDKAFLLSLLQRDRETLLQGSNGSTMIHITKQAMEAKKLFFPRSQKEQRQIGIFFKTIDKAITLHQRKLEGLSKLKKSLLQKMFPKNGSLGPELRFPGFTGDWEQHKLGDLGHTYGGLSGKSKQDFGHGDARFVTYMNVFSNPIGDPCMVDSIEIDDRQSRVRKGDVLFTTSSETPDEVGMSCVWPSDSENLYLNSFCFGYRPTTKINSNFLASLLRSPSVREKIIFLAQGISRYNISKNKVMEISIPLPSEEEQSQIGDFFTQLDKTITLHQRKLESLKKLKKSLLQQMFV